jgi:hypothetical protein
VPNSLVDVSGIILCLGREFDAPDFEDSDSFVPWSEGCEGVGVEEVVDW